MAKLGTDIEYAINLLAAGELVGIPTETVYGLAANCYNDRAVAHIFAVKNRPSFDPLIAHTSSLDRVTQFVRQVPDKAQTLAEIFWPGPLTLVLPKKTLVPDIVTSGLDSVAVRVPDHPLTLQLLGAIDFPLAAPSANPFGYVSPTRASHVNDQLGDNIAYILDGGSCRVGIESTIIRFDTDMPVILRLGGVTVEEIQHVIGPVKIDAHAYDHPAAPGMLESHYSPFTTILMGNLHEMLNRFGPEGTGILAFNREIPKIETAFQYVLSPSSDIEEAATRLFSGLRSLDQLNLQRILCEPVPDVGLGKAINDRLRRASSKSK